MIDKIIGGLIESIFGAIGKAIDPEAKAKLERVGVELENAVTERIKAEMAAASAVMVADAQSEGWLTRNARPLTVVWSLGLATWIVLVAPALGIVQETLSAIEAVPDMLWMLITVGIGAYPFAKALEKGISSRSK
jgi:hypothetical protein